MQMGILVIIVSFGHYQDGVGVNIFHERDEFGSVVGDSGHPDNDIIRASDRRLVETVVEFVVKSTVNKVDLLEISEILQQVEKEFLSIARRPWGFTEFTGYKEKVHVISPRHKRQWARQE
jgi:hypothetical protein